MAGTGRILVLFTETFANGGIQRFNRTFLAAARRLGLACDVLSLHDAPQTDAPVLPISIRGFSGSRVRFSLAVLRCIWSGRYGCILVGHINFLELASMALRLSPVRRARAVLVCHGIEVWYGITPARRRALRAMHLILCVSEYTRDNIRKQAPDIPLRRLVIFPNALGESWVRTPMQSAATGDRQRLPYPYVLSVTRLERGDRQKGVVTVLETIGMLSDRALHYVIVGRGRDESFLRIAAARFGIGDRVHFLGDISDRVLFDLYRNAEMFVLPSGKEGFGIVFLEAMYFGTPVIAAREKGAVDVVRHGATGLLVDYGDTIALRLAMQRLSEDGSLRRHLISCGRATVTGNGPFTFDRFVDRCRDIFAVPPPAATRPSD